MGPSSSLRKVLAAYGDSRVGQAHVLSRMVTCPVTPVVQRLPRSGTVLDAGCGHGLFSLVAALDAPQRRIVGVDIDADKLDLARHAAVRLGVADRVQFDLTDGDLPDGRFDAVMCNDVLYLLGLERARKLLADMAARVAPGGVVLVKDMSDRPAWKARWNHLQEVGATKVFRYTEGDQLEMVLPADIEAPLREAGLSVEQARIDRGYPHPHLLIVARRP